jgi:peptidase C25-like protein/CARDB protein
MRILHNVCFFIGSLVVVLISSCVAESKESLISPIISIKQNTIEKIVLSWNAGESDAKNERILFFAPGPVSSASYSISCFTWKEQQEDGEITTGDETNIQLNNEKWILPRINLREIGLLAGSRLAAFSIDLSAKKLPKSISENAFVKYPSGEVEILFSNLDEKAFEDFPKAIDDIAKKLIINYPPLKEVKPVNPLLEKAPYCQTPALKIQTRSEGIISIPAYPIIEFFAGDTGDKNIAYSQLALFRDRTETPFAVIDENGRYKSNGNIEVGDFIQYYNPVSSSPYSPYSVVWMASIAERHVAIPLHTDIGKTGGIDTLEQRIRLEEDNLFISGEDKTEKQANSWMWHDFIREPSKTIEFSFSQFEFIHPVPATVKIKTNKSYISLATDSLSVQLNGRKIDCMIERQKTGLFISDFLIAPHVLKNGTNSLILNVGFEPNSSRSDNGIFLDWVDFNIKTKLHPSSKPYWNPTGQSVISLALETECLWLIRNDGLKSEDIRLVHQKNKSVELPGEPDQWRIFAQSSKTVISDVTFTPVNNILAKNPLLTDLHGADVVVISPRDWLSTLSPFEKSLSDAGYRVRHAARKDIDDIFGDGRLSPHNIRDFLRFAYHNWKRPHASYVLLVGDATWDYWGRYKNNVHNYIPGYRENEKYAVENWFVRNDDPQDVLSDCIIARWPVRSAAGLKVLIDKTIRYKNKPTLGPWLNKVFVLTDHTFEKYSEELVDDWIPTEFRMLRRHIADYPLVDNIYLPERLRAQMRAKTSPQATDDIIDIVNKGVFLWDYFGHGAPNVLGNERMFFGGGSKYSDVRKLTNQGKLPILWGFTCETAKFDYPRDKWNISIGEDLLTFKDGGAIALVGATGRGYPTDHIVLARGMHHAAFSDRFSTLGQIFYAANLYGFCNSSFFEPVNQFAILGDPTIQFPVFEKIEGEITQREGQIDFSWNPSNATGATNRYEIWAENDTEILPDRKTYRLSNQTKTVEGIFQIPPKSDQDIKKLGVDSISMRDKRVMVSHGSMMISNHINAASLIEPSTGCLPELHFVDDSLHFIPESPRSGETVFLKAKVRNDGKAGASRISVQGYDVTQDDQKKMLAVTVGSTGDLIEQLNPGEKASVQVRWDPIDNTGDHRLRLTLDQYNRIKEENQDNNTIESDLYVRKKADLIVDATKVNVRPIESGKRFQVYFEIRNQGESDAEKIVVELELQAKNQKKTETIRLPKLFSIKSGAHQSFGGIKIPANIEYLEINIDPDEIVDEETHKNNKHRYTP